MSENKGRNAKIETDLNLLKDLVYKTAVGCETSIETAESFLEKGDKSQVQIYLNNIRDKILFLKGFAG